MTVILRKWRNKSLYIEIYLNSRYSQLLLWLVSWFCHFQFNEIILASWMPISLKLCGKQALNKSRKPWVLQNWQSRSVWLDLAQIGLCATYFPQGGVWIVTSFLLWRRWSDSQHASLLFSMYSAPASLLTIPRESLRKVEARSVAIS